ncbi:hypothetical protein AOLI_G00025720 [Acnodon oligacanthus]
MCESACEGEASRLIYTPSYLSRSGEDINPTICLPEYVCVRRGRREHLDCNNTFLTLCATNTLHKDLAIALGCITAVAVLSRQARTMAQIWEKRREEVIHKHDMAHHNLWHSTPSLLPLVERLFPPFRGQRGPQVECGDEERAHSYVRMLCLTHKGPQSDLQLEPHEAKSRYACRVEVSLGPVRIHRNLTAPLPPGQYSMEERELNQHKINLLRLVRANGATLLLPAKAFLLIRATHTLQLNSTLNCTYKFLKSCSTQCELCLMFSAAQLALGSNPLASGLILY